MSVSSKSGAAHVRPVGDDFEAPNEHIVAPEAKSVTEPAVEAQAAPQAVVAEEKPAPKRRKLLMPMIAIAALAAGGWYGNEWWTNGRFMISTDDAYIEGDIASISPKVSGYVEKVNVVANQHVKAGDPLITLDKEDYRIAADQATAQIDTE
ncbi:MAG: biotin/lipoyl-binding protein, partial [Pararhizobium sp.]